MCMVLEEEDNNLVNVVIYILNINFDFDFYNLLMILDLMVLYKMKILFFSFLIF